MNIIIIGFLSILDLRIFGALICPFEILSVLFFIYGIFINKEKNYKLFKDNTFKSINKLLVLWAFSQFISDIFNKTDLTNSLKGILTPILILLSLRLIIILYEYFNYNYFIEDFAIGISLCALYKSFLISNSLEYSLKMGGMISFAILIFAFFKTEFLNKLITFLLIAISFYYGIRSSLIIFSIILISNLFIKKESKNQIQTKLLPNVLKGFIFYLFIIFALFLSSPLFQIINSGIIKVYANEDRVGELKKQNQGGIFSARKEYYSFFDAFKDSPFIGHGSWAIDKDYKYSLLAKRGDVFYKSKTDRSIIKQIDKDAAYKNNFGIPYIPVHSYIQQSVIWGGITASFFFFYLLRISILIFLKYRIDYLYGLLLVNYIYNIFFSSIGRNRFTLPLICLITILCFYKKNNKVNIPN